MWRISLGRVLMVVGILFLKYTECTAEEAKVSPHSDKGDCRICHVAPAEKLRGWFVPGSTKRELNDDLNRICKKCHTVAPAHAGGFLADGNGHATGKKPTYNTYNLPLAADGTITCAITCHNIHVSQDERQLHKKHLRLPVNDLCMSCHNV